MSDRPPARVFISAGERSGDVHAANFLAEVRRLRPDVEFEGFGGSRMREEGCFLHRDMLDLSVMGLTFLRHLRKFFGVIRAFGKLLRERPPAALILVDFPGLHFILARLARKRGVPVVYYICPQIWSWAPWRRGKILRLTDLLLVILPFEQELYRNPRTPVEYVGHPLADELRAQQAEERGQSLRAGLHLPAEGRVIGLFPGSREQEVRSLMPVFRSILSEMELDPRLHRVLASSSRPAFRGLIEEGLRGLPVPASIEDGDARPLMAACDFALVASGTASLELAYYGKPMVVLYRVSPGALLFYRLIAVTPFISLVNILSGGEVVPERILWRQAAPELAPVARSLFLDTPERERCRQRLLDLREQVLQPGATERAARAFLSFLDGKAGR